MIIASLLTAVAVEFFIYALTRRAFNKKTFEHKLDCYWDGRKRYYVFACSIFLASATVLATIASWLYGSIRIDPISAICLVQAILLGAWLARKHDLRMRQTMSNEELLQEAQLCVFEAMIYQDSKRDMFIKKTVSDFVMATAVFSVFMVVMYFSNFWIGWLSTGVLLFMVFSVENWKRKRMSGEEQVKLDRKAVAMSVVISFITSMGFIVMAPVAIFFTMTSIGNSVGQDKNTGEWA